MNDEPSSKSRNISFKKKRFCLNVSHLLSFTQQYLPFAHTSLPQVQVPEECQDCQNLSYDGYEAFPKLDTNERRFLAFIEQTKKKSEEKRKASLAVMAPSGDFVVLEAKELIKHFTKDGLPKNLNQCQVLKPIHSRTVNKLTEEQLKDFWKLKKH